MKFQASLMYDNHTFGLFDTFDDVLKWIDEATDDETKDHAILRIETNGATVQRHWKESPQDWRDRVKQAVRQAIEASIGAGI
jgi:hypothetical protein